MTQKTSATKKVFIDKTSSTKLLIDLGETFDKLDMNCAVDITMEVLTGKPNTVYLTTSLFQKAVGGVYLQ